MEVMEQRSHSIAPINLDFFLCNPIYSTDKGSNSIVESFCYTLAAMISSLGGGLLVTSELVDSTSWLCFIVNVFSPPNLLVFVWVLANSNAVNRSDQTWVGSVGENDGFQFHNYILDKVYITSLCGTSSILTIYLFDILCLSATIVSSILIHYHTVQ